VAVVFDFDETLGCFQELSDLSQAIANNRRRELKPHEYADLLETLPNYMRPGIIKELGRLYHMRRTRMPFLKIMIYTNNMGGRKWVDDVSSALELLVKREVRAKGAKDRLFDQIIYAYSVNGVHLEKKRSSHEKKYVDFLACTNYRPSTKVIFVDDILHQGMLLTPHVKYLHVPAYKWMYGRARIEKLLAESQSKALDMPMPMAIDIPKVVGCMSHTTRPTDISVVMRHTAVAARLRKEIDTGIAWATDTTGSDARVPVAGSRQNYVQL
jgi:hypothetical protein